MAADVADNQKLAHALYGRIGRPPGRLALAWARRTERVASVGPILGMLFMANPWVCLIAFGVCGYVIGFPISLGIRLVAWTLGYPFWIPLLSPLVLLLTSFLVAVFVGIPSVLLQREQALAPLRRDIHASLAAALPERPGGPSRCRNCGAALEVPLGALGVPCVYCRTDNLVALPEHWVKSIRASEFHQFMHIDAALEAFRRVSETTRQRFWRLGFGLALMFPVSLLIGYLFDKIGIHF